MHATIVVFLSLVGVWLNIALSGWWPLWAIPIFLWIGIIVTIFRGNTAERWLWILSYSAWCLYSAGITEVLVYIICFAAAGELCNYLYKRYIPSGNKFLMLIPVFLLALVGEFVSSLINKGTITWQEFGSALTTTIIITIILIIYDPTKKEKNKYF